MASRAANLNLQSFSNGMTHWNVPMSSGVQLQHPEPWATLEARLAHEHTLFHASADILCRT